MTGAERGWKSPPAAASAAAIAVGGAFVALLAMNGGDPTRADGNSRAAAAAGPASPPTAASPTAPPPEAAERQGARADRLAEIPADRWIGAPEGGLSGEDLRGQVVLIEFWTYLCYNCKNVEPWMKETFDTYSGRGLRVIGVHTPEFDVEKKVENVVAYMEENGIRYPVAIDNSFRVWRKYNSTNSWPAFLVFDRGGELIYRRAGERAVHGAREAIEKALAENRGEAASTLEGAATGVGVSAAASRRSPGLASLEVGFEPESGFLLVKSPPNEVRLELPQGVSTPSNPAFLGEPFRGEDSGAVRYFEGPARLEIPLTIAEPLGARAVDLQGTVVYHVCAERTKVCARHETALAVTVPAS